MKTLLLAVALVTAVMISTMPATVTRAADGKRKATTTFTKPVTLQGVTLLGEYLFVHDDAAMARGEACTYVYKGNAEVASKLVASFHCTPVERKKATHFTWRTSEPAPGISDLLEFQFEGDTESHLVPGVTK